MIDDSELRERELKSELEANNPYSIDSFDSFDSFDIDSSLIDVISLQAIIFQTQLSD